MLLSDLDPGHGVPMTESHGRGWASWLCFPEPWRLEILILDWQQESTSKSLWTLTYLDPPWHSPWFQNVSKARPSEATKAFDKARFLVGANRDAMVPGYLVLGQQSPTGPNWALEKWKEWSLGGLTCQEASPHVSQLSKARIVWLLIEQFWDY